MRVPPLGHHDEARGEHRRHDPRRGTRRADAALVRHDTEAPARGGRQAAHRLADRGARSRRIPRHRRQRESSRGPGRRGIGRRRRVRRHAALVDRAGTSGSRRRHRHGVAAPAPRTGADRFRRRLHLVRLRVIPASGDGDGTGPVRNPRPSRAGPEPALPSAAAISRWSTASSRSSGSLATPTPASDSTIRTCSANFRAGRSSNSCLTSNGG